MYYVYILQSNKHGRYYIGHTEQIDERLKTHNSGRVKSTKNGIPWSLIYTEVCESKSLACRREIQIKRYKGGILFKKLIGLWKNYGEVA